MARKGTGKHVMYYCRHAEVSDALICNGLQVRAVELEQAIFDTIKAQIRPTLGIDTDKDTLNFQTMQQSEIEKKILSLQNRKRRLYEQYVFNEIDLESYKYQKKQIDVELVKVQNAYTTISSKAKQAQTDYEMKQKHQAVAQEVSESKSLTQSLSDRLINRVYIFKDNQIEIDYATKDFLVPD